ncbi:MAG: 30S ribosomal protein S18 [Planctomycetes bacterium]|nr:30S ribosomal protein S18 [Planctomycetota bacterium]
MPKKKSRIALARARQRRYRKFVDRGPCRFSKKEGILQKEGALPDGLNISYKDLNTLERLCSQQGKLFSRKRSGNSAKFQRQLKVAVKQARYLGLLPFVG